MTLFYLKWINPLIAIMVLLLCCSSLLEALYTSIKESEPFEIDFEEDFILLYFWGKGLFCSFLLWIVGMMAGHFLSKDSE